MPTSTDFHFPGEPYHVQLKLMNAIYEAIDRRQVGLFESPTGTGKTLSIICASLSWLTRNRHSLPTTSPSITTSSDPDWVLQQTRSREERLVSDEISRRKHAFCKRLEHASQRPLARRLRPRFCVHNSRHSDDSLDAFLSSDEEGGMDGLVVPREHRRVKSARIVFATRTHSQLAQFLAELRRTVFCPSKHKSGAPQIKLGMNPTEPVGSGLTSDLPLSIMPFGSRKQFCINDQVRSLESSAAISERCRELTEAPASTLSAKRKRSRNRCEYKNTEAESILRDKALVQMFSIEDLADTGKKMGACPYYAMRAALETGDVDVMAVPYSAILHGPTRQSLGLEIDEETIVIFDEAHNIVSTVCDLHSAILTRPALEQAREAIQAYMAAYETRFSATNLFRLRQLMALSNGFLSLLPAQDAKEREKLVKPKVVLPAAMLFEAGVDNINLFSLVTFMQESKLSKKLRGFVDSEQQQKENHGGQSMRQGENDIERGESQRAKQSVAMLERFIQSIADCPSYGRVALYPYRTRGEGNARSMGQGIDAVARLKYFVTEPGHLFKSNVGRARATLLLGGTLSPRCSITKALFSDRKQEEIVEVECEHVVGADRVLTRVCETGPQGEKLEFTYRRRQSGDGGAEIGACLERLAEEARGGVVVFFGSYDLLRQTEAGWKRSGVWERLKRRKGMFAEVRGEDGAFEEYREQVERDKRRGGILLAVMGGKLSEGINFSDELGRVVVMVGMPFANAMQVETGEMLKGMRSGKERSEFLENGCMTVVNQCIGRAVRHRGDYACVLLMDWRYGRERVVGKLPKFIRRDFGVCRAFEEVLVEVGRFFQRHTY